MINALRSAATGMEAQQIRIDAIANDLSNVNTVGYKKTKADFEDLYYDQIKAPGALSGAGTESPSGIQVGHGTKLTALTKIFTAGDLEQTNKPLDMAIQGTGFFQAVNEDGNPVYTRNGAFTLDKDGNLVTGQGHKIEPNITIQSSATAITISQDGIVSAVLPGSSEPQQLGQIQLAMFQNPGGLQYLGENEYLATGASGAVTQVTPGQEGSGTIGQGFLENSNVNVGESLITMIVAQRSYEANAKVIEAADRMMQSVNNIV